MEKKDVFISYSRKDTKIADQICAAFDRAGITYFIDRQGIGGGMEFPIVLAKAIMECKLFLFLASANSYDSKFTNSEITFAFNEKPKNCLLPYIIDRSKMPLEMRFIFSGINWRNIEVHPIESILVEDVMRLLGKKIESDSAVAHTESEAKVLLSIKENPEDLFGKGLKCFRLKDYENAAKWYEKAADMGHIGAQVALGELYLYGSGAFNNPKAALYWSKKAAESGNAQALVNWGICIWGYGAPSDIRDSNRAVSLFSQAAEKNNSEGQLYLGQSYDLGEGVPRDYLKALEWYKKSAAKGNPRAMYLIGELFRNGSLGERDYIMAEKWYRKSADNGNSDAQFRLASLYRYGLGVEKNMEYAKMWFKKAAANGHTEAIKTLDFLGISPKNEPPSILDRMSGL